MWNYEPHYVTLHDSRFRIELWSMMFWKSLFTLHDITYFARIRELLKSAITWLISSCFFKWEMWSYHHDRAIIHFVLQYDRFFLRKILNHEVKYLELQYYTLHNSINTIEKYVDRKLSQFHTSWFLVLKEIMKCGIVNFMISHFKSSHLMISVLLSSQFLISLVSKEIVKCDIVKFTIPYLKIKVYFSGKHRIVNFMITHFVMSRFSNENVKREIVNFMISYLTISFFYLTRTMHIPLIFRT